MPYFLALIILAMGFGGFYEYKALERQSIKEQLDIKEELGHKIEALQEENKKLLTQIEELKKRPEPAPAPAPAPVVAAPAESDSPSAAAAATAAAAAPPKPVLPSNDLGTFTTTDGKTYDKCQVLKVTVSGITINSATGITQVTFISLPPEVQKHFGFDPHQGAQLTDAQALEQENLVRAAATQAH